jgi:hypothetical protein
MSVQSTTRDKYKVIARAKSMAHDELYEKVQSHMLDCCDPDCDICDMGASGSMIDNDDEGSGSNYNIGSRSSKGREGAPPDLDTVGKQAQKDVKGDKENLLKHGYHTSKHPGFKAVAAKIASKQGLSAKAAGAILANRTRSASAGAKKANPRLKRVKG